MGVLNQIFRVINVAVRSLLIIAAGLFSGSADNTITNFQQVKEKILARQSGLSREITDKIA